MLLAQALVESTPMSIPSQALETAPMSIPPQAPQPEMALFALLPMLLGLATWIITLIVIWRAMKAHESIAESLRQIAQKAPKV